MNWNIRPGDRVVCIKTPPTSQRHPVLPSPHPIKGKYYTVIEVVPNPNPKNRMFKIGYVLKECNRRVIWASDCFRKLEPSSEQFKNMVKKCRPMKVPELT